MNDAINRAEWDVMSDEDKWRYVRVIEELLTSRDKLLLEIPECPEHGRDCIPHAIEWIQEKRLCSHKSL